MEMSKAATEYDRAVNREIDRKELDAYFKDKPVTMKGLITFALSQYMDDPESQLPFNSMATVDTIMANMAHSVVMRLLPLMQEARKDSKDMWASYVMTLGAHLAMVSQAYAVGTQSLDAKRDELRKWVDHYLSGNDRMQLKANAMLLVDALGTKGGVANLYQGPDPVQAPTEVPTTPDGTPGFDSTKDAEPEPVATLGDAPGVPPVAEVTCGNTTGFKPEVLEGGGEVRTDGVDEEAKPDLKLV